MTTRNYLFAADDASSRTSQLIATAARVTGFMKGAPGGHRPGWYLTGADNVAVIARLHQHMAETYPKAGPAFWAVRLWTNFLWQPAYLAVIAAHIHSSMPDLGQLSQRVDGIYADGYRLPVGPQQAGTPEQLIPIAAAALRPFCAALLDEINTVVKLKPLPARRLLADRMLSIIARLPQWQPGVSAAMAEDYAQQWLAALGLTGQGRLDRIRVSHGREVVIVTRKGCCLDYLIEPKAYCASCPKQDEDARIARQTANAVAELD